MIKRGSGMDLMGLALVLRQNVEGTNIDMAARSLARTAQDTAEDAQTTANTNADDIQNINSTLDDKEDKPTIITTSEPVIEMTLDENTIIQCDEVAYLTVSVPKNEQGEFDVGGMYIADISFTSGAAATNVTMPDIELCSGTDCVDNVFQPVANMRYNASIWYDGKYVVGVVHGNDLKEGECNYE